MQRTAGEFQRCTFFKLWHSGSGDGPGGTEMVTPVDQRMWYTALDETLISLCRASPILPSQPAPQAEEIFRRVMPPHITLARRLTIRWCRSGRCVGTKLDTQVTLMWSFGVTSGCTGMDSSPLSQLARDLMEIAYFSEAWPALIPFLTWSTTLSQFLRIGSTRPSTRFQPLTILRSDSGVCCHRCELTRASFQFSVCPTRRLKNF